MKKICLMIVIISIIFIGQFALAGGYEAPYEQQYQQQIATINNHDTEKHWYLEMTVGIGTLFLGALGLWLKYKKK